MKPSMHYDLSKLHQFIAGLDRGKKMQVKVGIMGQKVTRGGGPTNAEIGAKHEYGSFSEHIPMRSFLRMPLHQKSDMILEHVRKHSKKAVEAGDIDQVLKNLGVACEMVIGMAFSTGGFGQWKPLSDFTVEQKGHSLILIESRQMERAITSKVEAKQ